MLVPPHYDDDNDDDDDDDDDDVDDETTSTDSSVWDSQIGIHDCYVKCETTSPTRDQFTEWGIRKASPRLFFYFEVYENLTEEVEGYLIQYTVEICGKYHPNLYLQDVTMKTSDFNNYFSTKRAKEIIQSKPAEILRNVTSVCRGTLLDGLEKEIKLFIDRYFENL
jgi:hypothetical protein